MNDLPQRGHLRVRTVAEHLGVSPSTVRRMLAEGELDGYRLRSPKQGAANTPLYVTRASLARHLERINSDEQH